MISFGIRRVTRWMALGFAAVALAGLTPARPAEAAPPALRGYSFELNLTASEADAMRLFISDQDATGSFTGSVVQGGVSRPVTGVIADINGLSELRGNYAISFTEQLSSRSRRSYEGVLRLQNKGALALIAGTYVSFDAQPIWAQGTLHLLPILSGPFPFYATGGAPLLAVTN